MWTCTKCQESLEDEFESCWKCGATKRGIAPTADDDDEVVDTERASVASSEEREPDRVFAPGPCRLDQVESCWHKLFEDFSTSSLDFYAAVEDVIARRKIPGARTARLDYHEGGVASAKREYLRVTRDELVFDICAAPFGTGFFFSWWCARKPPSVWPLYAITIALTTLVAVKLPGLFTRIILTFMGLVLLALLPLVTRFLAPRITYYKIDTTVMFRTAVKGAVDDVIEAITSAKGLRPLTDEERKPIMRGFFGR